MAITVKHKFVSAIPDAGDTTIVQPSNWNDDHQLVGTVPVANGGTGASTLTGYVKGTGTTAMTAATTIPNTDITGLGTASTKDAGVANGVATLDSSGTVPLSQIPALGDLNYQGTWNATTNSPTLTSSVGTKGFYYVVSVAGTTNLNGITDWQVGDWAVYNGSAWQKIDNTDAVTSVNGYTGTVVLTQTDISGTVPTSRTITAGTGLTGGGDLSANRTLAISTTGVSAATYGSASIVPVIAVNTQGQITSATNTTIAIANTQVSGLGTMSTQNANAVAVTGGTINGTTIGATTASTGAFTYLSTSSTTSTTPTLSFNGSNSNIASGAIVSGSYLQNLLQNKSGTANASTNYVLSNDLGTDSSYYGEFGMNSSVYSSGTPADFFSLNNGVYFSGHDGDVTVGSGNGYKTYFAWGTSGQSAHVINASGAIGLNTSITGSTNFGTNGQVLTSAGSGATPTWTTPTTGTVTSVTGTSPIVSSGGNTPAISMPAATTSVSGYLTSTDWNTFNGKQAAGTYVNSVSGTTGRITSTGGVTPVIDLASGVATAGTTGSSTLIPVVTIDTYGRVTGITTASNPQGTVTSVTGTAPVVSSGGATPAISMAAANTTTNGYLTSTDWNTFNGKSNTNGTVTSVAALTLGTTGTDLSSTVATGTTTPVITLQVPTASATNRGALSSTDWSTFNGKQASLVSGTNIKTVGGVSLLGAGDVGVIGATYGGTGVNNGSNTITLAGNLTHAGAFTQSYTATANTAVTLPAGATAASNNLLSSATAVGIVTGTPSSSNYLRGDGTWSSVTASSATNLSGGALGSVPYQLLSGSTTFLAGNTTTTPQFLTSTGVAGLATAPTLTSSTGSGSVVLATSPTLVTPVLGTPASGNLANCTGYGGSAASVAGSGITGSRNIPKAAMPAGTVLQTVTLFYNTTVSFTGTAYSQITGLNISITPTSATSTILILSSLGVGANTNNTPSFRLTRNGTAIALSTTGTGAQSTMGTGDANSGWMNFCGTTMNYNFVDSPATTSATTYGWQVSPWRGSSGTTWINRSSDQGNSDRILSTSSITLLEIAA